LKLNATHQRLVYADDVNILGVSVHAIKENTEALVATKEIRQEIMQIKLSTWSCLEVIMQDESQYKVW